MTRNNGIEIPLDVEHAGQLNKSNIPEGTLETTKNVRDSSKNTSEQDDKKCSPLEKTDQVTSDDKLNAYGESDRDDDLKKTKEHKKNTW